MSIDTAREIVRWVMDTTIPGEKTSIGFFGGEPLLRFNLMQEATEYIRVKEEETGKVVNLNVTSNGTLLNDDILDFLKAERIDLCVSIDGPKYVHDKFRRYKDGGGTFDDVASKTNQALERLGKVQVNAVFNPSTMSTLPERISFFANLGVSTIHLNPDIRATWPRSLFPRLREVYLKAANLYIESYQQAQEIAVNLIDSKILILLKGGYGSDDKCGMGETELGFAPSGNIYPCERLVGEDNGLYCLGNIHTGIDLMRRCNLIAVRGNRNKECKTCNLQRYCMNWCGCTNYHMTGYTDLASAMMCASEKAAIEAATHVLIALQDDDLFLNHFIRYLHEERQSELVKP